MWRHGKIRGGWKIIENILQKLVENSQNAIDDGIYDITETLPKSEIDLQESIKNNSHASLITEIKFSSPAEGDIRQISDPVQIAKDFQNLDMPFSWHVCFCVSTYCFLLNYYWIILSAF